MLGRCAAHRHFAGERKIQSLCGGKGGRDSSDHLHADRCCAPADISSQRSSGSMRAESAVEPTKSENITVTWRRSAAVSLDGNAGAVKEGSEGAGAVFALVSSAIASKSFLRWPTAVTPKSLTSSAVSFGRTVSSTPFSRKAASTVRDPVTCPDSSDHG
jgi:hypothetical protein